MRRKSLIFTAIVPAILAIDFVTKRWALDALLEESSELFGGLLPLTLAFNKGAAFGLSIGEDSRWFFIPVTIIALILLAVLLRQAEDRDWWRVTAISLVVSGALGNLWDRVRWDQGVVDFLGPVDLIFWNFPIFNVADMAITTGAIMLAISFWLEDRAEREREQREREEAARAGTGSASALGDTPTASPDDAASTDETDRFDSGSVDLASRPEGGD